MEWGVAGWRFDWESVASLCDALTSSSGVPRRAANPRPSRLSLVTIEYLHAKFDVSPSAAGSRSVAQNALSVAWGFAENDVPGDPCIKNDVAKEIPNFAIYLMGQLKIWVEHRQEDPPEGQSSGLILHDVPNDMDHLGQSFHRVVFALDRHDHLGARGQSRLGQFPERRGRIDDDRIENAGFGIEVFLEPLAPALGSFFKKIDVLETSASRENMQSFKSGGQDRVPQGHFAKQRVSIDGLESQAGRCVALGVQIDQQRFLVCQGQSPCQVDGRGRLADSPFLVCNAEDSRHRFRA